MSYSFTVTGVTANDARKKAAHELDKVVANQDIHEHDREGVERMIHVFTDLLGKDTTRNVQLSVSGSVQVKADELQQVSCNIDVQYVTRVVQPQTKAEKAELKQAQDDAGGG